jgi:hypothetical protein
MPVDFQQVLWPLKKFLHQLQMNTYYMQKFTGIANEILMF